MVKNNYCFKKKHCTNVTEKICKLCYGELVYSAQIFSMQNDKIKLLEK